jgi:hypothetical protein
MFTGENTLKSIEHFLAGYQFAITQYKITQCNDELFIPHEFHDWVAYRLHFFESTSGWCNMICAKTESDNEAIALFFKLLIEFRSRKPHVVARVIGRDKKFQQIPFTNKNGNMVRDTAEIRQFPDTISLITYTDDPGFFAYSDTQDDFPFSGFFPSIELFENFIGIKREELNIVDNNWHY